MIERPELVAKLESYKDRNVIKVVTGVRRCGKSCLLELYRRRLAELGVPDRRIVSVDLDLMANEGLRERRALHDHFASRRVEGETVYAFVDEAQRCPGFEDAVEGLFAMGGFDIYLTGSNASLLSGELATLLAGRYVEVPVLPLSFAEWLSALPEERRAVPERAFRDYVRYGGFPEVASLLGDPALVDGYLEGVFNTVLVRDVATRHSVRDMAALGKVARYLFSTAGSLVSGRKVSGALTSSGHKVAQPTVENYLEYLADARLFYKAERFDVAGKERLATLAKYYAVDTGLRNQALGFRGGDRGHLLENVVYLELLRRGNRVWVGKAGGAEIDFVVEGPSGASYVQVAESAADPAVLERELAPLRAVGDFRPRALLTLDWDIAADHDGIASLNVVDWLLGRA